MSELRAKFRAWYFPPADKRNEETRPIIERQLFLEERPEAVDRAFFIAVVH